MSLSTTRAHSDTNKQKFKMWSELKGNYAKLISCDGLSDMLRSDVGSETKVTETETDGELASGGAGRADSPTWNIIFWARLRQSGMID